MHRLRGQTPMQAQSATFRINWWSTNPLCLSSVLHTNKWKLKMPYQIRINIKIQIDNQCETHQDNEFKIVIVNGVPFTKYHSGLLYQSQHLPQILYEFIHIWLSVFHIHVCVSASLTYVCCRFHFSALFSKYNLLFDTSTYPSKLCKAYLKLLFVVCRVPAGSRFPHYCLLWLLVH